MARALLKALETAGYSANLASRFRSRDASGSAAVQQSRIQEAEIEIRKIIDKNEAKNWQFWLTYHNYYKTPDLIGPPVSRALNIPYLLVEATRARKRLGGPWDTYARAAEAASEAADAVFYLTRHDAEALVAYAPDNQKLVHLSPFLSRDKLPPVSPCPPKILSVGMFRTGDKLASYEIISQALTLLNTPDWHLTIVGDGPARPQVEQLMSAFGQRVTFTGTLGGEALQDAYRDAGLFFWPGVNEAFGMVYLEAQAAGLPVVAQDRPGVRDVLARDLLRPPVDAGPQALAHQIDRLLLDHSYRKQAGVDARQFIEHKHLLKHAGLTLATTINEVLA